MTSWVEKFFDKAAKQLVDPTCGYHSFFSDINDACNIIETYTNSQRPEDLAANKLLIEYLKDVTVAFVGRVTFGADNDSELDRLETIVTRSFFDEQQKAELLKACQDQIKQSMEAALAEGHAPAFFDENRSPDIGKLFGDFIIDQAIADLDRYASVNPFYAIHTCARHYFLFNNYRRENLPADPRAAIFFDGLSKYLPLWSDIPDNNLESASKYFGYLLYRTKTDKKLGTVPFQIWEQFMDLLLPKNMPSAQEQIDDQGKSEYKQRDFITPCRLIYEVVADRYENTDYPEPIRFARNYLNNHFKQIVASDPYGPLHLAAMLIKNQHWALERAHPDHSSFGYKKEIQGLFDDLVAGIDTSDLAQNDSFTLKKPIFIKIAGQTQNMRRTVRIYERAIERCDTEAESLGLDEYIKAMKRIADDIYGFLNTKSSWNEIFYGADVRCKAEALRKLSIAKISEHALQAPANTDSVKICLAMAEDKELDHHLRKSVLQHVIEMADELAPTNPLFAIDTLGSVRAISTTYNCDDLNKRANILTREIKRPMPLRPKEMAAIKRFAAKKKSLGTV